MIQTIGVFCASQKGCSTDIQSAARALGRLIACQGRRLLYGGSNLGCMGLVSSAALEAGGHVVAVIPNFFPDDVVFSQPVTELVRVEDLSQRKQQMLERCGGFVALPGGIGTLDELSDVLAANQLQRCRKPMGLLNVGGFYDPLLRQFDIMRETGLLRPGIEEFLFVDDSPDALLARMDASVG